MDAAIRHLARRGELRPVDLARAGLAAVWAWNGRGPEAGDGGGIADGYWGGGSGSGGGYGNGLGHGNGNGYGNGDGDGDGDGYYGDGHGHGHGNGEG